jgi:hypothetical protein
MQGFWYIATPYSNYSGENGGPGLEVAVQQACKAAAHLIDLGLKVYSPIAHTDTLAMKGDIDPLDHDIWMPQDEPFMEAAKGLIVVTMDGWDNSKGVREEIYKFREMDKPIVYMEWDEEMRFPALLRG